MKEGSENFYIKGINKVQDYIEHHLDEDLNIKDLAGIAAFSEFHFLRIYTLLTGESLYAFIKRLRMERSAFLLTSQKERTITDIAFSMGFSNQASFAKAFKNKFGISASEYRRDHDPIPEPEKLTWVSIERDQLIEPLFTEIRREKKQNLIYIRYTGPYKGDSDLFSELFQSLYIWAKERGLVSKNSRWFVIYHDFGYETDETMLRLSVCMSVDQNVAVSGRVGYLELDEGVYGVGRFLVDPTEYGKAWYYMFAKWLPENGYMPDERFALEHYPPSEADSDGRREVEIYIPLKS